MSIMNIFKPKYKHSNPDVRCEAIKELDDQELLESIVHED